MHGLSQQIVFLDNVDELTLGLNTLLRLKLSVVKG